MVRARRCKPVHHPHYVAVFICPKQFAAKVALDASGALSGVADAWSAAALGWLGCAVRALQGSEHRRHGIRSWARAAVSNSIKSILTKVSRGSTWRGGVTCDMRSR